MVKFVGSQHQVAKKKDLIAETLGGEKSVGEEALGVVICQPF